MFGTDSKYLTISINDGIIKAAQVSTSGNVEKIARVSYNPGADEAAKALKAILTPFNKKLPIICVVPASAATAKNIEVPSSDPEEIKSIINLQASRHTPYSREEVLISTINLGLNPGNNTRLLLVIAHRDVVKEKISILEKAGLGVDKVLFVPEAEARFYIKALNLRKEALSGIIDFSINSATFMVVGRNSLLFVRHIPVGIKALMEGADATAKLQDELKKSMDAFVQEDGNKAPTSYTITASRDAVKNILPVLKEALGVDFQVNPFINFIKGSGDVKKKLQGDFGDDSFLDVIAPASVASKSEINLMPEEMLLKKTVETQSKEAIMTGIYAIVIMVLFIIIAMSKIYFKDTYLNKNLREHFASQKSEVEQLQLQMNKAKLVRTYIQGRMASLDILHELYSITPNTIYLSNVSMDNDGTITVSGVAESMSGVYAFKKSLEGAGIFNEVKDPTTTPKKDNGKDVTAFEIGFKLNDKEPAA